MQGEVQGNVQFGVFHRVCNLLQGAVSLKRIIRRPVILFSGNRNQSSARIFFHGFSIGADEASGLAGGGGHKLEPGFDGF